MKRFLTLLVMILPLMAAAKDHTLHVISTGDVHGSYFADPYMSGGDVRNSLMSVKDKVDLIRDQVGAENVLLLDIGDFLQGDDAAYYFNYVAADVPHVYPRMASYMGYDAVVLGNHDVEAGHPVYDRVYKELSSCHIPWLAANALKNDGEPYFDEYAVFRKAGLKVLVVGFTNANIKAWLNEKLWKGISFEPIVRMAQSRIDAIVAKEKPQVVIVAAHTGTGKGDGAQLENEGLDLFAKLKGVDLIICAHDHKPFIRNENGVSLMNGGARCANIGHATISVTTRGSRVVSKSIDAETVRTGRKYFDKAMKEKFLPEFNAVREYARSSVGTLAVELRTRDAYSGMCDYVNLLHTVQLESSGAQVSFAAPLTYDGTVKAGEVLKGNMFTIYPFENELFVLNMTGKEIVDALEFSYNSWICTPGEHVLNIENKPDSRTGSNKWSFKGRPYNFDSAAGINYTVDVTKPVGSRVVVTTLADGTPFDTNATYAVAMTSYRATGGGGIIPRGAGIKDSNSRIVSKFPEIRDLIAVWIKKNDNVTSDQLNGKSVIGEWKFVPEDVTEPLLKRDIGLLFGE